MKTVINRIPVATLKTFAEQEGLTLVVNERGTQFPPDMRFYASFDAEVKEGDFLVGAFGNGSTPAAATREYASKISEKTLVIDVWSPRPREVTVPRLTR